MTVLEMWKANAAVYLLLVVLNASVFTLGNTPWIVIGMVLLALAMFYTFRQGMNFGHRACGILQMASHTAAPESPAYGQVDASVWKGAWSPARGVRGVLACGLVPYCIGCAYIACSLLNAERLVPVLRLVSWLTAMPFWPLVLPWTQTFDRLTGTVAAVLMISPFVLPLCMYAGYMQGPKLWARSEKAMAEGRRRAKAKSRVNRKRPVPRAQRPEI